MCMRQGENPAEVAPAALAAYEQREVMRPGGADAISGVAGLEHHVDLSAMDRPYAIVRCGLGELHRAGDGVVVGERKRRVAQLAGALYELLRQRDTVQERVRRVAVQLDVWRSPSHWTNQRP